jgi:hypothetical protein
MMSFPGAARRPETDARNRAISDLRKALVSFGNAFDLLTGTECDCDDPTCPNRSPETMTAERLLDWLADAWHGLAGCGHVGDEAPPPPAVMLDRNRWLVAHFARHMETMGDEGWRSVLARFRDIAVTPLFEEAASLVSHGVTEIFPDAEDDPACQRALHAADAWADAWALDEATLEDLGTAIECAALALFGFGIADARLTEALYEPFAAAVPLNELVFQARSGAP